MGLTAILESIERETAAEADRQLEAARAEAAGLIAAAESAAQRRLDAAVVGAEPLLRAEAARIVNAARLRQLRRRSELAAAQSDGAWARAREQLAAIVAEDGPRWHAGLAAIATEALAMAGADAIVAVRAADAPPIEALVAAAGAAIEPLPDDAPTGLLVRSADRRLEVDARLDVRLERARTALVEG